MTARQREILDMCSFLRCHIKTREGVSNLPALRRSPRHSLRRVVMVCKEITFYMLVKLLRQGLICNLYLCATKLILVL